MNNAPTNEYRPMSAWGYLGYQFLFTIPLVGFILLIVFALDNSYIARRNFARSYFCLVFIAIIFLIFILIAVPSFFAIIESLLPNIQ